MRAARTDLLLTLLGVSTLHAIRKSLGMHWQIVRAIRRRLQDERGVALLMALGILLVLSLGFATSIALTSSGARHAERSKADQKAYALAEEGVNNAISVIHANSDAAKDVDCYDPLSFATYQNLLTPARTNTRSEGSVSWSGEFFCSLPPPAGEGPFWKITSTATVNNPGGPGSAAVTRTTTAKVPLADALVPTTTVDYVPVETPTTSVTWVPTESVELQPVATYSLSTVNDGTGFSGGSFMYSFGDFATSGGSNLLQQAIIVDGNFVQSGGGETAQVQASATVVSVKGTIKIAGLMGLGAGVGPTPPVAPPKLIATVPATDDLATPTVDESKIAKVTSVTGFPTTALNGAGTLQGMVVIDDEYITYSGVGTTAAACNIPTGSFVSGMGCFTGLVRGFIPGHDAAMHVGCYPTSGCAAANVDGRIARVATKLGCIGGCDGIHTAEYTTGPSANVIDTSTLKPNYDVTDARNNAALGPGVGHGPIAISPASESCPFNFSTPSGTDQYYNGGAFALTPAFSYKCKGTGGTITNAGDTAELSWDNTTKELKVRGAVYIPGNVTTSQDAFYTTYDPPAASKSATLFVAGKVVTGGTLCGLRVTVGAPECDTRTWNPNTMSELAIISPNLPASGARAAQTGVLGSHVLDLCNCGIQGYLYTDGELKRSGGDSYLSGTAMAGKITLSGGHSSAPAPGIFQVPVGTSGQPRTVTSPYTVTNTITYTNSNPVTNSTTLTTFDPYTVTSTSTTHSPGNPGEFGG